MGGYDTPSLDDQFRDDRRRIAALESAVYVFGDPNNPNNPPLTITGFTPTIEYYAKPITGDPAARITWTWTAPAAPDADDLTADPVVDYMLSVTTPSVGGGVAPYASTKGATTVMTENHQLNTTITGRVYAVTRKGLNGPIVTATANIAADTVPPPQPSTPVVTAATGAVRASYNGRDVTNAAMPSDFSHVEVHSSTTGGATFTPSTATFFTRLYGHGGGTVYIDANPNYDPIYVRLVPVDKWGNVGVASTGAGATPEKLVKTDLDVVLPGDIAYSDVGNLILDGSFENDVFTASRLSSKTGTVVEDTVTSFAYHGDSCIKFTGTGVASSMYLNRTGLEQGPIAVVENSKYYFSMRVRGVSANGVAYLKARYTDTSGVYSYQDILTTSTSTGSWVVLEGVVQIPVTIEYAEFYLATSSAHTTGTWYFDTAVVRNVVPTALIEDAAITRAKIATLAVGDAQIENLHGAKIIAQTIASEQIKLGAFNTNLVPDPSFEEDYPIETNSATNKHRWRIDSIAGASTAVRYNAPRSGNKSMKLTAPIANTDYISILSGNFDVVPGETYVLSVNANRLSPATAVRFYVRMAGGSTDALTEYPGTSTGNALPFNGEIPLFVEDQALTNLTEPIDPTGMDNFSGSFTVPAGVTRASVRIYNWKPYSANGILNIDDISVVKLGQGAAEITSAGVRLFGKEGTEVGAFVSNRPNYFSVSDSLGNSLASISGAGEIAGQTVASVNDIEVYGRPLIGNYGDYESPTEQDTNIIGWLDQLPRGVVSFGSQTNLNATVSTSRGIYEVSFLAQRGRSYRITGGSLRCIGTGNAAGLIWRLVNPSTVDGEAASPSVGNGEILGYAYVGNTGGSSVGTPPIVRVMRCNVNDGKIGSGSGELNPGIVKVFVMVNADTQINTGINLDCVVEDIGPDLPRTHVTNLDTAGGSSGGTTTVKTYTKTYNSTGWAMYQQSGTKKTSADDVKQGYSSYDGDAKGLWVFPSMTGDLTGATVKKIEVYLYANHWYYNSGGTALIKTHAYTSVPASSPSMSTAISSSNWPKPGGRWVKLPSSTYAGFKSGSNRGIGVGPAGTTNLLYYGRFSTSAKIRVTYEK